MEITFPIFFLSIRNLKSYQMVVDSINSIPKESTSQHLNQMPGTRSMFSLSKWLQQEESVWYSDFN